MKKALIVHFGNWSGSEDTVRYENESKKLAELLEAAGVAAERLDRLPDHKEIAACDAVVFISIGLKKHAREIKKATEKLVFMITGLTETVDEMFEVITLEKKYGYHENAKNISEIILNSPKFLIRTAPNGIANRDHRLNWHSMPEWMLGSFEDFLIENALQKDRLEKGGVITINSLNGYLTENVRLTRLLPQI